MMASQSCHLQQKRVIFIFFLGEVRRRRAGGGREDREGRRKGRGTAGGRGRKGGKGKLHGLVDVRRQAQGSHPVTITPAPLAVHESSPSPPCGRRRGREWWGGRTRGTRRGCCRQYRACECRKKACNKIYLYKSGGPDPQIYRATYVSKGISTPLVLKEVVSFGQNR